METAAARTSQSSEFSWIRRMRRRHWRRQKINMNNMLYSLAFQDLLKEGMKEDNIEIRSGQTLWPRGSQHSIEGTPGCNSWGG